jgi:ribosomal protein L7/L12
MTNDNIPRNYKEADDEGLAIATIIRTSVIRYLRAGQVIDAIKLHRHATGMGLGESKHAVERIRASVDPVFAEKYADPNLSSHLTRMSLKPYLQGLPEGVEVTAS